jgi:hypothetical protein
MVAKIIFWSLFGIGNGKFGGVSISILPPKGTKKF